jgi:hypothetical protein
VAVPIVPHGIRLFLEFDELGVEMRLSRKVAGTLFTLLLLGVATAACGSGTASSGPVSTKSSTTTVASPTTVEAGPTLSSLTSMVQGQITRTGGNGFGVSAVVKVTCRPPAAWKTGATFKCYAYDFASDEIGEYDGTVTPDAGGLPQWNSLWSPR